MARETIEFDVVIVGGGPAGLSAACRLGQLAENAGASLEICVVEKGSAIGAHILSGAVFETRALDELFNDWREREAPVSCAVTADRLSWLRSRAAHWKVPEFLVPRSLLNAGNFVISLGELCHWLGGQAEQLGCHVLTGVAATELLLDESGSVNGVATGAMGLGPDGKPLAGAEPGYELRARYVVFAEGCRGSLARELDERFDIAGGSEPQHYGIGFKEVWEVDSASHSEGAVEHTIGWPLGFGTEGGGFVYHAKENRVFVGFIVSLGYTNPHLDPFLEFQRWKQHPRIRSMLAGGRRVAYGARVVNRGGLNALRRLALPGGLLVGCEAGFLNPAKIKGSHTAMKTGMLAAEAIYRALAAGDSPGQELCEYVDAVRASWVWDELNETRNFASGLGRFGMLPGAALAFFEQNLLRHSLPLTIRHPGCDRSGMIRASQAKPIHYPPPDGVVSFDRLSSVHLANTQHREDQPVHLVLEDPGLPVGSNLPEYDEPAQRYCPAGVYEVVRDAAGAPRFQINAANCIHCKACDIKDPADNIRWTPPEGGSGPNYVRM